MQRPEQQIQRAILQLIRYKYPKAVTFHIPNGGRRSKIEASIFKTLGVRAGVSDLCIMWAGGNVGFLEIKSEKGRLSENQLSFMDDCARLGIPWECVKSADEAAAALKLWCVA